LIIEADHPHAGRFRQPRPAARFDATPAELRSFAPTLGEHTDAILAGLGLDPAECSTLRAAHVIA
jgi:crotonobetainyl-CoA:carnitine CoA-transferase CaiB-like acyl-CoA transferase